MRIPTLRARVKKAYAKNILRLHQIETRLDHLRQRHGLKLVTLVLAVSMVSSAFALPFLQSLVGGYFTDEQSLASLKSLLGGTGAALIGAATIAFSLVVFAMQINVERMPHGLFKQFSSDSRLLCAFIGSFLTALVVAGTSLIPDGSSAISAIVVAIWGIVTLFLLFFYAFRRALQLINPIEQLAIASSDARRDLRKWSRLAAKASTLVLEAPQPESHIDEQGAKFDIAMAHFYQVNAHWTKSAKQAIHYAISYAKRFAEQGDYEVTDEAFRHIMLINATYCAVKGRTFIGSNPLFEIPGTTDSFINSSLEQLRQTMQAALAKGDEQLAESTLRAFGALYGVYLEIEYSRGSGSKHHALLAGGYMGSAVESVIPHNMPDLMMEGIRLLGRTARLALDHTDPAEIVSVGQKIGALSYVGVLKPDHQPVTLTAFEQLADITYDLLAKGKQDIRFPVRQLRSAVSEAAKRYLETPDTQFSSIHQRTLSPYFSSTNFSSLRGKLTALVNELLNAPADHERAIEIIRNIETWTDQIYDPQKELLLLAVRKQSFFTIDIITWAAGISELLNALSNAPSCTEDMRDKLRRHAIWLISTLSWIPDDRESVTFAETFSITEKLFEAALDGYRRECVEFYQCCKGLLTTWARKGGKHETGWGILEHSVKGLVALAVNEGTPESAAALQSQLREMLASELAPSAEVRDRAAANLARDAGQLSHLNATNLIERTLAQQDHSAARSLLLGMVDIIAVVPPANQRPANERPQ